MADLKTGTGDLLSDQTAYERLAYFALRPEMYFANVVDVKPTHQTAPGSSVKFTIYTDLSAATASLDESTDIDAVAMSDAQVDVPLDEYGNAVVTTAKLRGTSFLNVDADAANLVGYNAGLSLDTLVRDVAAGGTNVRYSGNATARNTVGPDDTLTAANIRRILADLRGASVQAGANGYYRAFIHPDVSYDLRSETGAAAWRDPHTYSQPHEIWTGEIGAFEGFAFIETPRAPKLADAGSSTTLTDVYQTIFCGKQAIAHAYSLTGSGGPNLPRIVLGPTVDKLERFSTVGWKFLGGWARFREAALRRYESSSSIGSN